MEFWTRSEEQLCWKEWPDAAQGLASLADQPPNEVLLLTRRPGEELPDLLASLRVVRQIAGDAVQVVVGSPFLSDEWLKPLREAGIDRVWWVERRRSRRRAEEVAGVAVRVEGAICPALHARTEDDVTLSVCGRHGDRMVLAPHHLERWCLHQYARCPHWRYGPSGWWEDEA